MKALSLWQPWASFIAIGVKPFETRSWPPPRWLIGQRIAIHAAKKTPTIDEREWARRCGVVELPLGAVVCTARLTLAHLCGPDDGEGNIRIVTSRQFGGDQQRRLRADEYGNYADGRWAWALTEIEPFGAPIPARGAQGLFEWQA